SALAVGSLLFFVPGAAWVDRSRGDVIAVLFRTMVVSLAGAAAIVVLLWPRRGPSSRAMFLLGLWTFTNAGLLQGHVTGRLSVRMAWPPVAAAIFLVAACFFAQSFVGAAYRIPALEDQDYETQGTAYGLIHHLSPS